MNTVKPNKKKSYFLSLSLKNYLNLNKSALFNPRGFVNLTTDKFKLKDSLIFFTINFVIGLFLRVLGDFFNYNNLTFVFLSITEIILILPFALFGLLFLSLIFFILAKLLKGQGSLVATLQTTSFASTPLIIFWLPFLSLASLIWFLYLILVSFSKIHKYPIYALIANIFIPTFLIFLVVFMLGIVNF